MKYLSGKLAVALLLALGAGTLWAQSPPLGGYANSPYSYGTSYGMYISNVEIKQGTNVLLNHGSTPSSAPYNTFFGAVPPALMVPTVNHTITVTIGGGYQTGVTAWVDFNNDGTFNDTNERVFWSTSYAVGPIVMQWSPPAGAAGNCRMRFRTNYYAAGPYTCYASYYYGEAKDYLVNFGFSITTSSPLPTAAQGSPYNQVITATNGTTPYTWNTAITGLPPGITATPQGNNLLLSGTPTTVGNYNFVLTATDSKTPTPDVAQRNFQLDVVPPPAPMPFSDSFSTATGWQLGATWQRAPCVAYAPSGSPPRSEPGTDATASSSDNFILGDNIGGDYATSQGATNYAISPMVNCTNGTNVKLRFRRWLGCSIGTTANISISNNGTQWTEIWSSIVGGSQTTIRDTTWTTQTLNIGQWANGSATVQIRFGIGPTGTTVHTGWCIDDFEIYNATSEMEVREGGATGTIITDNQAVGGLRNFGQVPAGRNSALLTIAITNNGAANLTFPAPSIDENPSGSFNGNFYFNAPAATFINPLPPGQTATWTIQFNTPSGTSPGIQTCQYRLYHNAGGGGTQIFEINVQAEVIPPAGGTIELRLGSATGPVINHGQSATGTPRDFGQQDINAGPTGSIQIFVKNIGTGTLYMTPPDLGGTWYTEFVVDNTGFTQSVAAGASTSFLVAFDPNTIGVKDAEVRIPNTDSAYNGQGGNPSYFSVPVLGTGFQPPVTPSIGVKENSAAGAQIPHNGPVFGTTRDFGSQVVTAGPTATITIWVENQGGQTLTVSNPTLAGTDPTQFVLGTTGYQTSLAAGAGTSFTVAFDPSSAGQKDAVIRITHNSTNEPSPFLINVTGLGVITAPVLVVKAGGSTGTTLTSPAAATGPLDFGVRDITAGASTPLQIYIENTGNANLSINNPVLGGSGSSQFILNSSTLAASVAPGGNTSFTIAFDPSTTGVKNAQVTLTTNGSPTNFVINVTGTGVPPGPIAQVREATSTGTIVTSGSPAAFASYRDLGSRDVAAGPSSAKTLVIVNQGTQALTITLPSLSGTHASQFGLNTAGFTGTVAAGGNWSFTVVFDPSAVGVKEAEITFTHNDTSGTPSPYVIPIVGTGTSPTGVIITTTAIPGGQRGQPYTPFDFTAVQGTGPYSWSLRNSTLPAGLTLSSTGTLSGTPTVGGAFNFTIRVTDSTGGTYDQAYSMAIGNAPGLSGPGGSGCSTEQSQGLGFLLVMAALAALTLTRLIRRRA